MDPPPSPAPPPVAGPSDAGLTRPEDAASPSATADGAAPAERPPPASDPRPGQAILAFLGLLAVGYSVLRLADQGFAPDAVGLAGFATRTALGLVLLAAAWRPREMAALVRAPGLVSPPGLGGFGLMAFTFYFVFGVGVLVSTTLLLQQTAAGQSPLGEPREAGELLASLGLSFALFTLPSMAWAIGPERLQGPAMWHWLRLRREGARWSIIWAVVAIVLVFWVLMVAGLAARILGFGEVENPQAEAIAKNLTLPMVLVVAVLTGVGEEVFFRGFLLRKVGNPGQAVLFGLAHLNYLQGLEVLITGFIGYAFGRTAQRTGSLAGPIFAHALFNAVNMLLFLYRDQLAGMGGT